MGTVVWMATRQSQIHRCATMSQANLGTRMMRVCIKTLTRLPLSCAIGARAAKAKLCESTIVMGPWRDGFAARPQLARLPRPLSHFDDSQHPLRWTMLSSWYEDEWRYWLRQAPLFNMFSSLPQ